MNLDKKTGISIIKISPELDAGDIIIQESLIIDKGLYSDDLKLNLVNLVVDFYLLFYLSLLFTYYVCYLN